MGCGTSANQVHEVNDPTPINQSNISKINKQQSGPLCLGKCYLFGQSAGQRKVVNYSSSKQHFTTLSSRIRIPTPKIKLQPIQILYQQSQQIILPQLMRKGPNPPFNHMFGTFCKRDVMFLCGGVNYEGDQVMKQAYFYNINPQNTSKPKSTMTKTFVKFQNTSSMATRRYNHMGIYYCEKEGKSEYIYIFGGRSAQHESLQSCERFDIIARKWKDIRPMYTPRSQGFTMLFMGNIYVFGGVTNFKMFPQSIEVYNPTFDTWRIMDIRLHRGIRACLIIAPRPNQIIIFGGNTMEEQLRSVIRVNLIEQTYIWQTNMPEELSNIKASYENDRVTIFSNHNNLMYAYEYNTQVWRTLGSGYKNYIPVHDLHRFTCVTEPLHVKFDSNQLKQLEQKEKLSSIKLKYSKTEYNSNSSKLFIFGNENYPCMITLIRQQKNDKQHRISIQRITMNLRLKSKMVVLNTQLGYFICGGSDSNYKQASADAFLYNPESIVHRSTQELMYMHEPRFLHAAVCASDRVYVFGGLKDRTTILRSCEKYDFKQGKWTFAGQTLRLRYGMRAHALEDGSKILLMGGREEDGSPSSFIQVYDTDKQSVVSYAQFPALVEGLPKDIFIRRLSSQQKQHINQQSPLLQISQFYSKKQYIKSPSPIPKKGTNKSPSASPVANKKQPPSFGNLVARHIPSHQLRVQISPKIKQLRVQQVHIKPNPKSATQQISPIGNENDQMMIINNEQDQLGENSSRNLIKQQEMDKVKEKIYMQEKVEKSQKKSMNMDMNMDMDMSKNKNKMVMKQQLEQDEYVGLNQQNQDMARSNRTLRTQQRQKQRQRQSRVSLNNNKDRQQPPKLQKQFSPMTPSQRDDDDDLQQITLTQQQVSQQQSLITTNKSNQQILLNPNTNMNRGNMLKKEGVVEQSNDSSASQDNTDANMNKDKSTANDANYNSNSNNNGENVDNNRDGYFEQYQALRLYIYRDTQKQGKQGVQSQQRIGIGSSIINSTQIANNMNIPVLYKTATKSITHISVLDMLIEKQTSKIKLCKPSAKYAQGKQQDSSNVIALSQPINYTHVFSQSMPDKNTTSNSKKMSHCFINMGKEPGDATGLAGMAVLEVDDIEAVLTSTSKQKEKESRVQPAKNTQNSNGILAMADMQYFSMCQY